MRNLTFKTLGFAVVAAVGFTACNGLGKMVKNANKVTYSVTPSPMEEHADSVAVSISGKYPPKFFAKKAVLTVTPTIKWNGGEKTLKPVTLVGEKAVGSGTKIPYATGGNFSYNDKVAYQPEMKVAELTIKATGAVKKKTKEFPATKIADGTIITPMLIKNDEKALWGKDNFQKVIPRNITANIYYVVNQSTVRPAEMTSEEMKAMKTFIETGVKKGYTFKNMNVSAYASPDGEQSLNANLANERAKSGSKAMMPVFKDKKTKVEAGSAEAFYNVVTTAEDWEGFKKAMEASSIPDKELVLRVLTMYTDLDQREKEIKNMAKTYTEISDGILPKLRRSVMTLNAEEMSRTDAQISALATTTPDSLSVEEILYAVTLTKDVNTQAQILKAADRIYSTDWRCVNNLGAVYLMQNKVSDAEAQFAKADKISANNPVIQNNMGIVSMWKGDRKAAAEMYKAAMAGGPEVSYNMGIVQVKNGEYANAVTSFGSYNDFNAALAKLLNGSGNDASTTLDAGADKDAALSDYLRAIIAARSGNAAGVMSNLKTAIGKDASLKAMAKDDCEFLKWRNEADFKAMTN